MTNLGQDVVYENDDDNESLLFSGVGGGGSRQGRPPRGSPRRAVQWALLQTVLLACTAISVMILAANVRLANEPGPTTVVSSPAAADAATTDPLDGLIPSFNATTTTGTGTGGPSFIAAYCTGSKQGVVLSVPRAMLDKPFVLSNLIAKASGTGDGMLHTPADYDNPVYTFARSRDGLSIDMRRLQVELRTSTPQYDALMTDGAWTGWFKSFPIKNPGNATATDPFLIDMTDFALVRGLMIGTYPNQPHSHPRPATICDRAAMPPPACLYPGRCEREMNM